MDQTRRNGKTTGLNMRNVKRSINILGHATSITLEDAFWDELKTIAKQQKISLSVLIAKIDKQRPEEQNLSSAIRVYVLESLKKLVK